MTDNPAGTTASRHFSPQSQKATMPTGRVYNSLFSLSNPLWFAGFYTTIIFDKIVKGLFLPESAQRTQRKFFKLQPVTSWRSVISVVDFLFLRHHHFFAVC
ncbi:MAG: hypothetical protein ACOY32_11290 [Thermodesulfobacteriota bacterium]